MALPSKFSSSNINSSNTALNLLNPDDPSSRRRATLVLHTVGRNANGSNLKKMILRQQRGKGSTEALSVANTMEGIAEELPVKKMKHGATTLETTPASTMALKNLT